MNNSGKPGSVLKQKTVDIIRDSVVKAEKDGKLTKAQSGLIQEQSWFKIFTAAPAGGNPTPLPELLETLEGLAWADGSFGWLVTKLSLAAWAMGFLPVDGTKEMTGADKLVIAGSSDVAGTAEKTKSGYTVNGQWQVTGAADAGTFIVNCTVIQNGSPVKDEANKTQVLSFLLLKNEVAMPAAWNAMGLTAVQGQDIEAKNLKVATGRAFKISGENAAAGARIYQFPYLQLSEAAMAVNVAGMATRFTELCEELLKTMKSADGMPLITDNMVQDTLEKYIQKMNDARVKLYYAVELSWQACVNQQSIKDTILYKVSAAAQDLTKKARECVDALYPFCGIAATDKASDINRVWRDLHTASQESLLVFGNI